MKSRWVIALASAGAVAVLTVPMLLKGASRSGPAAADEKLAKSHASCDAEGSAKLDFVLKDHTGAPVKLADYKGKVVMLNFWGSWCPPCKAEIPGFIALEEQYRDKGLAIVGVAVEDTPDAVKAYASEAKINYRLAMTQDDIEDAYGPIYGLPITFLITRDGSICNKHIGPVSKEQAEREIKSLL